MEFSNKLAHYNPEVHLVFNTEAEAVLAETELASRMGLSSDSATARWDVPQQVVDGRWIIIRPD